MKNNKGFATTFVVFGLLILFLTIMAVLLFTLNNSSILNSRLRNKLIDKVENENIYNEYNFVYTGDIQVFTAPRTRTYKIKTWSSGQTSYFASDSIQLKKGQQIYIYVGNADKTYNSGNSDVRNIYGKVNDETSINSIIVKADSNGTNSIGQTSENEQRPSNAGNNGYVRISYYSISAGELGYDDSSVGFDCDNVKCSLEKIDTMLSHKKKCKRADETELHSATINGNNVVYGQVGTNGILSTGDAFICDVNGDGEYDAQKEMFYYVSDYYDTENSTFDSDYAVFVYYSNVTNGKPDNSNLYRYSSESDYLPSAIIPNMPTTKQWSNVRLNKTNRSIRIASISFGTRGTFQNKIANYIGRSARLLTTAEIKKGCPDASLADGSLDSCNFLFENSPYWLETHLEVSPDYAFLITNNKAEACSSVAGACLYGVRPAIEVKKSDIDIDSLSDDYIYGSYIQSSGTQYINTGYIPSNNGGTITAKFEYTEIASQFGNIYGVEHNASPWNPMGLRSESASGHPIAALSYSAKMSGSNAEVNKIYTTEHTYYRIDSSTTHTKFVLNGSIIGDSDLSNSTTTIQQLPLYLFAANINGTGATRHSKIKLYYLKIYNANGNIVRDYLPAKRKSDNAVGLYDKIGSKFYTNLGTGTFVFSQ